MAKTPTKTKTRRRPSRIVVQSLSSLPIPPATQRAEQLLSQGTLASKVAILKEVGILTSTGKLAPKYKSWGNRPTRTPTLSKSKP
jgi:hypothetical protein